MSRYVSYRDFDSILMAFVLIICGIGVMEIHSATMHTKFAGAHVEQVHWVVAGVGAMFLVSPDSLSRPCLIRSTRSTLLG